MFAFPYHFMACVGTTIALPTTFHTHLKRATCPNQLTLRDLNTWISIYHEILSIVLFLSPFRSKYFRQYLFSNTIKLMKNKILLDITYYFIVLLIGSTCFGHYYAHHQELATIMLITTSVIWFLVCCSSCFSLQPGHYSSLTAPNLQPTANQERNDQCGNQHHSL